ncbi:MAG: metal-dependent transcriptional regulator [Clostridiales bacterium]|nr:metal-dependent transcriptional regulator [Clostridiales bacterium]MCD8132841.1 metal-dependent transcriptional regulator [Clostridiales bacterium]
MKKQGVNTMPMARVQNESREDYLEAIYLLSGKEGGAVRSVRIAEFMGFSKASVSRAVSVLKEDGYVETDSRSMVFLTREGMDEAKRVYRKHCYFEDQLLKAGVDAETANAEACRMEHAISDNSFEKLMKLSSVYY